MKNIRSPIKAAKAAVALLVALGIVTSVGAIAWTTWADYRDHIHAAESLAQQVARLVEEHAERYVGGPDQAIQRIIDRIGERALDRLDRQDWEFARSVDQALPHLVGLFVHDRDGKLVLSSRAFPAPDENYADRDYRQAHLDGEQGLFIGPLIKSRSSTDQDKFRFTLSRPILRDGKYAGLVVAAVDVAFFKAFYDSLNLGKDSTCLILRTDGRVVVRQQPRDEDLGRSYANIALFTTHLVAAKTGTYRSFSASDGIERIHSYRAISNLPLVALAGIPTDLALAEWRPALWRNGAAALALVIILLAAGRLAWAALNREEIALSDAERARAAAERASDAKSRFLASASHDLRQPFQAMRLYQDLLVSQLEGHRGMLTAERLGEAMQAGEELLDNLLHLSTLDAGMVRVERESVALRQVAEQVVRECEMQALAKGLTLSVDETAQRVVSDRVLLARILRNLVVNAIRYTTQGGVHLSFIPDGASLAIQVKDTGIGIDPDQIELIFEDFYQIDNPARDRREGLGLGLSIVSRTARLLGHSVAVRSNPGEGSTFAVTVPLAMAPEPVPA